MRTPKTVMAMERPTAMTVVLTTQIKPNLAFAAVVNLIQILTRTVMGLWTALMPSLLIQVSGLTRTEMALGTIKTRMTTMMGCQMSGNSCMA